MRNAASHTREDETEHEGDRSLRIIVPDVCRRRQKGAFKTRFERVSLFLTTSEDHRMNWRLPGEYSPFSCMAELKSNELSDNGLDVLAII